MRCIVATRRLAERTLTWPRSKNGLHLECLATVARRKACVAVARKLAVIIHAMRNDRTVAVGNPAARETDAERRAHVKDRKLLRAHR